MALWLLQLRALYISEVGLRAGVSSALRDGQPMSAQAQETLRQPFNGAAAALWAGELSSLVQDQW